MAKNSTDISAEDSVEFRRCWALGETYYFLKNHHHKIKEDIKDQKTRSKAIKFYRNQLISLSSLCKELGFEDENIENFLEKLEREKINDELKPNFGGDLESYLIGHLNGIDPRYIHIFKLSKHTQKLYELGEIYIDLQKLKDDLYGLNADLNNSDKLLGFKKDLEHLNRALKILEVDSDEEFNEIYKRLKNLHKDLESCEVDSDKVREIGTELKRLGSLLRPDKEFSKVFTDLENLKNYISPDKISLIQQTIQNWQLISTNWEQYKSKESKKVPVGSYYHIFRPVKFVDIINKFKGLITGSVEIYDILTVSDLIVYNFVIYAPVVTVLFLISYFLLNDFYIPLLDQLAIPNDLTKISSYITALVALVGCILTLVKAVLPLWKRGSEFYKLRLAVKRLKSPKGEIIKIIWN